MQIGQWLETLSWKDAESLFQAAPPPLIILPLGAQCKEHGLHLPLNNDWVTARYFTERLLNELPAVALPILPYGNYPAFLEYPGSVSVRLEAVRDTVIDICHSIARHGPNKIYILNTGISTNHALEPARQTLAKEKILMDYTLVHEASGEVEAKLREQEHGTHADEIETSMMLYIAPEIVKMKLAQKDAAPDRPGPLTRDPTASRGVFSPTGAWGDPTLATQEKGRAIVEARLANMLRFLREFTSESYQAAPPRTQFLQEKP